MLRIHLLGRPRLFFDTPLVASGRPKVLPLLAYLLLQRDRTLSRAEVAAALWPDDSDREARANLRRHLYYLGDYLPPPDGQPWVVTEGATLRWNPECDYWLDVAAFQEYSSLPSLCAQAVELYEGDLLAFVDEEWLCEPRDELARRYETCLSELVASAKARRDFQTAIGYAQRLLEHDPWQEDALRQLMILRSEIGDKAGALHEFERFVASLRTELGAEPMPETSAVQRAISQDLRPPGSLQEPATFASVATPSSGMQVPFIARESELARLGELWLRAGRGHGATALISGEAGIGKTRLTSEVAVACELRGGTVLAGSTGFPEATPYEAFLPVIRGALAFGPVIDVDAIWLAALGAILPGVSSVVAPPLAAAGERQRLFESFALVLDAVAKRRPVLVIIEDLHWAGTATFSLLRYLSMRLRKSCVLIVGTYREGEALSHEALRDLRADLERNSSLAHLALGRLRLTDIRRIVADGAAAADLHARSGGNPFFLLELLRAEKTGEPARATILARLGGLSDESRTLAHLAAVAGPAFSIDTLTGSTGWPEARVLDAIDELIAAHIFAEHPSHAWLDYAFSHQLIQGAIYDSLDGVERTRRHRRLAQAMQRLYRSDPRASFEVAHHWERSGETKNAAHQYLVAARYAASLYAFDDAYAHVKKVLELAGWSDLRYDALLLQEQIVALRGNRAEQSAILDELSAIVDERAEEDEICTVLRRRIDLASATSDIRTEQQLIAALRARAIARASEPWQLSALEAQAKSDRSTGNYAGAQGCFEQMRAFGSFLADRNTYAVAHMAHADVLIYQGRLDDAQAILHEVLGQIDAGTNRTALVRTLMTFSRAALAAQDYPGMSDYAAQALEISRTIGDREGEALALHNLANGNVYTFHVEEAQSQYDSAMVLYEHLNLRRGIAGLLVDRGLFMTELGLLDDAMHLYERAANLAREIDFPWVLCVTMVNASYCERLRGNYDAAKSQATRALAAALELGSLQLESAALGTLGAAERELGEYENAIAHLKRGVQIRRPAGATPRLGDNLCALALAELRAGEIVCAQATTSELIDLYQSNPRLAPQPAEWLSAAAQVYRACGQGTRADSLLDQASSIIAARTDAIADASTRAAFLNLPFNRL